VPLLCLFEEVVGARGVETLLAAAETVQVRLTLSQV